MAESAPKSSYSIDPTLYLYTSLTSGSSHIVTATSRLETILKANRVPFKALDLATDEKARMLWGRRAGKDESGRVRKLPGLVQMGLVVGDLVEIEDWNEYGELKMHVKIVPDPNATPVKSALQTPISTPAKAPVVLQENKKPEATPPVAQTSKVIEPEKKPVDAPSAMSLALRQVGEEAAQKAKDNKKKGLTETFSGVGKAEPAKEKEKEVSKPEPIAVPDTTVDSSSGLSSLQSPTSGAWRGPANTTPTHSAKAVDPSSLQSPTSSAWRPLDVNPPVLEKAGSKIIPASAAEIKKIEDETKIDEEDEESDSEDEGSSSEEEENLKKPVAAKTTGKAVAAKEESSSESEDSEEDEDSDDEEEETVRKPVLTKAVPKPSEESSSEEETSSEEDDDDEEDAKVATKPKVAAKEEEEDTSEESESSGDEAPAKSVKA